MTDIPKEIMDEASVLARGLLQSNVDKDGITFTRVNIGALARALVARDQRAAEIVSKEGEAWPRGSHVDMPAVMKRVSRNILAYEDNG